MESIGHERTASRIDLNFNVASLKKAAMPSARQTITRRGDMMLQRNQTGGEEDYYTAGAAPAQSDRSDQATKAALDAWGQRMFRQKGVLHAGRVGKSMEDLAGRLDYAYLHFDGEPLVGALRAMAVDFNLPAPSAGMADKDEAYVVGTVRAGYDRAAWDSARPNAAHGPREFLVGEQEELQVHEVIETDDEDNPGEYDTADDEEEEAFDDAPSFVDAPAGSAGPDARPSAPPPEQVYEAARSLGATAAELQGASPLERIDLLKVLQRDPNLQEMARAGLFKWSDVLKKNPSADAGADGARHSQVIDEQKLTALQSMLLSVGRQQQDMSALSVMKFERQRVTSGAKASPNGFFPNVKVWAPPRYLDGQLPNKKNVNLM